MVKLGRFLDLLIIFPVPKIEEKVAKRKTTTKAKIAAKHFVNKGTDELSRKNFRFMNSANKKIRQKIFQN